MLLFLYVGLSAWVGLFGVFNAYLLKMLVDHVSSFTIPLVLLLINSELHNFSWRGLNLVTLRLIPSLKSALTQDLFNRAHEKPYPFFQKRLSGAIAQDIAIVTDAVERTVSNIAIRFIRGAVQLIVSLVLMGLIHLEYAIIFLIWTISFMTVSALVSKKTRAFSHTTAKAQSDVSGEIVDSFSSAKEVKLFAGAADESLRLDLFLAGWRSAYKRKGKFFLKFYLFQGFTITCLIFAMASLLIRHYLSGFVTIGDFVYILSSTFLLTEMIWANTELIDQFNEQMGRCYQSLSHLLTDERDAPLKGVQQTAGGRGEIFFDSIAFSHSIDRPLFKGISLKIRGGEKMGIVGRSGAGKSTLIHLLLGFYSLKGGRITLDGQDISALSSESLYRMVAVVSQNPSLFQRSIHENIRFSNPSATDEMVIEAARLAGLRDLNALPLLSSDLSGGERQRVAIARAILKNAPILILDEPTAHLDALTEREVKDSLYRLMEGRTTIAITHSLATLQRMDRIIVLDQGKILEEGTHDSLLLSGGRYRDLWDAQVGSSPSLNPL